MAAARKGAKKVISKDELRRLMKEQKAKSSTSKRIDSPLVKYNSLGQLFCVLCNIQVKSELLWNAHLQGRTHKETVAELKARKNEPLPRPPAPPAGAAGKRKADDSANGQLEKKSKIQSGQSRVPATGQGGLPDDFFDATSSKGPAASSSLALAGYDSSGSDDSDDSDPPTSTSAVPPATGLPADFFDPGIKRAPSAEEEKAVPNPSMAEKLPEGFFDDPKQDAKVREVVFKDKMEEEWENFQKSMKEESTISAAIVEEEDEVVQSERNIDEIDEQLHRWSQVDRLQKQKEEMVAQDGDKKREEQDSNSEADEQEFEEFLDWRTKKAWQT